MSLPPPSAEQQLHFLGQLQRIFSEGSFVASYKFALLHALADIAVERGSDDGGALPVEIRTIAERIIHLYWRQVAPFPSPAGGAVVLRQIRGARAAILRRVQQARDAHGGSLVRVRQSDAWPGLVREAEAVVKRMPLWKLQTAGGERLDFLFDNLDDPGVTEIVLKPGVMYGFRTFHPLVIEMVRSAWLRFVRVANPVALGESADLGGFLFGSDRSAVRRCVPILR
jgi:hypothetical protein